MFKLPMIFQKTSEGMLPELAPGVAPCSELPSGHISNMLCYSMMYANIFHSIISYSTLLDYAILYNPGVWGLLLGRRHDDLARLPHGGPRDHLVSVIIIVTIITTNNSNNNYDNNNNNHHHRSKI